MSGCAEKQATSIAEKVAVAAALAGEARARMHASDERIASVADSIAEGEGCGAVKPVRVQFGGREGMSVLTQAEVMDGVELGLMRRIDIAG